MGELNRVMYEMSLGDIRFYSFVLSELKDLLQNFINTDSEKWVRVMIKEVERKRKSLIKEHEKRYEVKLKLKDYDITMMGDIMNKEQAKTVLEYIRQLDYKPNPWENKFLIDMEEIQQAKLSAKQSFALMNIYEKASGGGKYERKEFI